MSPAASLRQRINASAIRDRDVVVNNEYDWCGVATWGDLDSWSGALDNLIYTP